LVKEIHGRVATDGHFREHNKVRTSRSCKGTVDSLEYAPDITIEIPDYRIDLTKG
jgi:hypothetical protein